MPRTQLVSAAALSSISVKLARAMGPAVAGVPVAQAGVAAVFAVDAASFVVFALAEGPVMVNHLLPADPD